MSKKLIAFALAGIFAFGVIAPAKAVTIEELQTQITALLAQITALQAQIAGQTTTGMVCFNTDLSKGMTSDDVKNLQIKLGVTPTSGYFGSITFAAVKTFQTAHGIINTGYVGPLTRAALNALYCIPPTTTTTTAAGTTTTTVVTGLPAGCTSTAGFSPTTGLSCATVTPVEGSITVTQNPIPGSGTAIVYGGNVNKEIAAYKIRATNTDVRIKRIFLQFDMQAADFPWRDLSSLSLWDGTTLLETIPASQANWTEVTFATRYTMQFDGLDILVAKDTDKVLSLKATAVSVPQYNGNISVLIPAIGIRGVDTAGLSVYSPTALGAHWFATAPAQPPTLTVSAATDNPKEGNAIASLTSISRVDLLKISAAVAGVDMTFKSGQITLTTDNNNIISGLELYDGSTLLASAADPGPGGTATWSVFTLPVSAGTTKVFTVKGVLPAAPTAGSQLALTLPATVGLVGVDTNGTARNNGTQTITGNTLRVYTIAPTLAFVSQSFAVTGSNSTGGHPNDLGSTSVIFSVTANGGDIYIPKLGNTTTTAGIDGTIYRDGIVATPTSSKGWVCSSPAVDATAVTEAANMWWRIPAGSPASCQFTDQITNTGGTGGNFQVGVTGLKWSPSFASSTTAVPQTWGFDVLKTELKYLGI